MDSIRARSSLGCRLDGTGDSEDMLTFREVPSNPKQSKVFLVPLVLSFLICLVKVAIKKSRQRRWISYVIFRGAQKQQLTSQSETLDYEKEYEAHLSTMVVVVQATCRGAVSWPRLATNPQARGCMRPVRLASDLPYGP